MEREIFDAARLIQDTTARRAYLERACAGDEVLRRRVETLLNALEGATGFLERPVFPEIAPPADDLMTLPDSPARSRRVRHGDLAQTEPFDSSGTWVPMAGKEEYETPLDFLESSDTPGSLGRLGHYEVLEVLGKGGFGIVFRALDETLQRMVAIKVLSAEIAATSPARKRFLREARSSAQVRHENVVQVYAVEEQPLPYLVMEFIPGETVQQRIDRTGPLEMLEVLQLGWEIAEGLAAAHGTGLIHRDIKPGNILIEAGPDPHVKITDFGLARAADDASMTQSGTVAGTPMFMAPEQARGEKLDHRADLFSFGSVLYAMCTGRPPFRAPTMMAVLKRVVEDTPRPIPEIIPEVPQWLCDIITRLHAKNPADRFSSAREVADLLAQHLAELQRPGSVLTPPVVRPSAAGTETTVELRGVPEAARPFRRPKSPTRRWAVAAAVLVMLGGGLGFTETTGVTDFHGTVIRLFSPEGTLVVEVDDPAVSIKVDGSDFVIMGAGAREIRLQPGRYTVEASKHGKIVRQELVNVTRNGRQVVRVSHEALPDTKAAIAVGKGLDPRSARETAGWQGWPSGGPPPAIAPFDAAQARKHQGAWARYLEVPVEYTNVIGMKFVWLPPGSFLMGSPPEETGMRSTGVEWATETQHKVTLTKGFYMGLYAVTQEQWQEIAGSNPSTFRGDKNLPVEQVSWNDCQEFIKKLREKDTKPYRLPTEAEWEYACRAGTATAFFTGETIFTDQANYNGESYGSGKPGVDRRETCPVGGFSANPFGLHDMHGNVWQWCQDWQGDYPQTDVVDPQGPENGLRRILRGGAWNHPPRNCRSATRLGNLPSRRHPYVGFRICFSLESDGKGPAGRTRDFDLVAGQQSVEALAWERSVSALPARAQVKAVAARLQALNPGFDGTVNPAIENGVVMGLKLTTDHVTDISPVRVLTQLRSLDCSGSGARNGQLIDLSPLRGLRLTFLSCSHTRVDNLAPLEGMPLKTLYCSETKVSDLSPLKGSPLEWLDCAATEVADLTPLQETPLRLLACATTNVSDLSPLKNMPLLRSIDCTGTQVTDLSPLEGTNLTGAGFYGTRVFDLSPLKGLPLEELHVGRVATSDLSPLRGLPLRVLHCDFQESRHAEILCAIRTLEKINNTPAAQFWAAIVDRKIWERSVAAMPAVAQVKAVAARLQVLNRGFDGKIKPTIEDGVVTGLKLTTDHVTDLSPARVLTNLRSLDCSGSDPGKGRLSDLSPLKGIPLEWLKMEFTEVADLAPLTGTPLRYLNVWTTKVSDLSPLLGMPLTNLIVGNTDVSDLSPLKAMPLEQLWCHATRVADLTPLKDAPLTDLMFPDTLVSDLAPLKHMRLWRLSLDRCQVADLAPVHGMPLKELYLTGSAVTDLSPLEGAPLRRLGCNFQESRDAVILRAIKTLERINEKPAAQFWKEVDEQARDR